MFDGTTYQEFSYVSTLPYNKVVEFCDDGLFPLEARGITFDVTDPDNPVLVGFPDSLSTGSSCMPPQEGLIIVFLGSNGPMFKTSGSFRNEVSELAFRIFNNNYSRRTVIEPGWTYCFELIYSLGTDYLNNANLVPVSKRSLLTGTVEPLSI